MKKVIRKKNSELYAFPNGISLAFGEMTILCDDDNRRYLIPDYMKMAAAFDRNLFNFIKETLSNHPDYEICTITVCK